MRTARDPGLPLKKMDTRFRAVEATRCSRDRNVVGSPLTAALRYCMGRTVGALSASPAIELHKLLPGLARGHLHCLRVRRSACIGPGTWRLSAAVGFVSADPSPVTAKAKVNRAQPCHPETTKANALLERTFPFA